ncbi:MAG: SpoIIE family protein phosphatase, partial [Candidatus Hodarchaeota archaeon]
MRKDKCASFLILCLLWLSIIPITCVRSAANEEHHFYGIVYKQATSLDSKFFHSKGALRDQPTSSVISTMQNSLLATTLFDEYKRTSLSAAATLQSINEKAFSISKNDIFFTALYAIYDFEKSSINIASAGGIPPIHFSARNKTSTLLTHFGSPLGVFKGDESPLARRCVGEYGQRPEYGIV